MSAPNRRISAPRSGPSRVLSRPGRVRRAPAGQAVGPHAVELAGLLHELSVGLLGADDFAAALDRLTAFAVSAIPGVVRCSVVLIGEGGPLLRAGHGTPGAAFDEQQYAEGTGPALEAARTRAMVTRPLLTDPGSSEPVGGAQALVAIPMDVRRAEVGAVSLFLDRAGEPGPDLLLTAMAVVSQAEVLLGELRRRDALSEGAMVDRAAGVIIAQRGCGVQEAYEVLRDTAQRLGLDRRTVAERLIAVISRSS